MESAIQSYLRAVVAEEREAVPAGSFVLYRHPFSDEIYRNYAIPAEGAESGDGTALIAAARERGLVPRLEYVESCFPWVKDALAPDGFVVEAHLRVMTCAEPLECDSPAEIVRVEAGSPLVRGAMTATRAAFGEGPPSDEEVERSTGRIVAAVLDGEVVAGAGWTRVLDGMSEVVGVGVLEEYRRRGIAGALTAAAAREAFAEGATLALLTPGDDDTARVYERAGFTDATTMLHLRTPN